LVPAPFFAGRKQDPANESFKQPRQSNFRSCKRYITFSGIMRITSFLRASIASFLSMTA